MKKGDPFTSPGGKPKNRSTRHPGLFWAILIPAFLLATATAGVVLYRYTQLERAKTLKSWEGRLKGMADDRERALNAWVGDKLGDARVLASIPPIQAALARGSALEAAEKDQAFFLLNQAPRCHGYTGAFLLDGEGRPVAWTGPSPPLIPGAAREVTRAVLEDGSEGSIGFFLTPSDRPAVAICVPCGKNPPAPFGAVLLVTDPHEWLYPLLLSEPTPTQTGESLIVCRKGQTILFLSPTRFRRIPPISLTISYDQPKLAGRLAVDGVDTFGDFFDYRGVPVFAATRRIQDTPWGLVVKVDQKEAFSEHRKTVQLSLVAFGLLLIVLAVGSTAVLGRQKLLHQRELALRDERFKLLKEFVNDAIYFMDAEGRILEANDVTEKMYGYSRPEFLALSARDLHPAESSDQVAQALSSAQSRPFLLETFHLRKDGSRFPAEVSYGPAEFEGRPVVFGIVRDITERRRAEEDLRASEARLRAIFSAMTDVVLVLDREGRYLEIAPTNPDLLYKPAGELIGRRLHEVFPAEQADFFHGAILRTLDTGQMTEIEYSLVIGDQEIHFEAKLSPMSRDTVVLVARDVTERKRAEELLRVHRDHLEEIVADRTAQLEAANKELEAFSYSVSHDLRAPLRAMDGFSRILLEEHSASLAPEAQRQLGIVRSNAVRMGRLIDDLLAFSRLSRKPVTRETVDVAAVVHGVLDDLRGELDGRRVEISIGDLPPCEADAALLKQVWVNLLANALKFTRRRETAIVEVGSRQEEGETIYFVRDNGVGFDMRYAHKLFGVFQRLHGQEEFEGTGVGLAIVQRIVHRHGGRAWAEGEVEKGAVFQFTVGGGIL